MRCLQSTPAGLALSPEGQLCAPADLVVFTAAEADQVFNSPVNLTVEQGAQLGASVLLVWATAWAIRAIACAIGPVHESDEVRE